MVETDPRVAELIDEIDRMLLPGPRKRVTDDVVAWGKLENRDLTSDTLLKAYNEAVDTSIAKARSALEAYATEPSKKQVLFTLLSAPRATDLHRLITLDALAGRLERSDLSEFGRVNARQRPGVVPKVRELLRQLDLPEAKFLLRRVVPGFPDDPVRSSEEGLDGFRVTDTEDARADLMFQALVLSESQMAELKQADEHVRHALATAVQERDALLIAAGRTSAGLTDYQSVLRRELHILALISDLEIAEETRTRSRDSIFGLELGRFEQGVAPSLPAGELAIYISRALSSDNRRNRSDRAVTALHTVGLLPQAERADVREHVVAALSDSDDHVRFAAAAALAHDYDPTGEERPRLVEAAASLPDELREKLQPMLGAVGSEIRSMSFRQVIDWAEGAPREEAERRACLLLEEWERRAADTTIEDAEAAMAAISRKVALPLSSSLGSQLVDTSAAWLRERRGTAVATRALIDGWEHFADFAIASFAQYGKALNAKAARRLLAESVRPSGAPRPDLLAVASGVQLEGNRNEIVLMPVLREVLARTPVVLEEAVDAADDEALTNLMVAAVLVIGELGRSLDDLNAIGSSETTEALRRMRAQVVEALEVAERDSVKNEELRAQLELVRDALGFDSEGDAAGPTETVAKWRADAVERYEGLDLAGDHEGALLPGKAPPAELVDLMLELDPRVHGRGVVPARDRPHYARDLANVVAAYVALDAKARPPLPRRTSPKLREEIERATSSDRAAAARSLAASLASSDETKAARTIAIVSRAADVPEVISAVYGLSRSELRAAAPAVARALVGEYETLARAREAQRSRDIRAAGEIARRLSVPFQAIETRLFSYFRLRAVLEEAGWQRVAPHLGAVLPREQIDPSRYSVRDDAAGDEDEEVEFLVRSSGIEIAGQIVDPAVVEPVVRTGVGEEEEDK